MASQRHITTKRDRRSRKYRLLHQMLAAEVAEARKPEPSKADRKRAASAEYRQTGQA